MFKKIRNYAIIKNTIPIYDQVMNSIAKSRLGDVAISIDRR